MGLLFLLSNIDKEAAPNLMEADIALPSFIFVLSLQETRVLPMLKNVGKNEKYIRKGYADVHHDVGKNIERNVSTDKYQHNVGKASPDT
ncbi:hypothetical protein E5676_scaffold143G00300 [Cucumis melo var. makuwa]|uniref:Uncharacterized protein n=1 Tax=Cucumis melo var. makuwa TaxID=1194695 RepID=A0A5D3C0P9_CUCMM|nr:hypothetical protein E5676_scaffold143G00300 [Cucumis melo var. makuwa]